MTTAPKSPSPFARCAIYGHRNRDERYLRKPADPNAPRVVHPRPIQIVIRGDRALVHVPGSAPEIVVADAWEAAFLGRDNGGRVWINRSGHPPYAPGADHVAIDDPKTGSAKAPCDPQDPIDALFELLIERPEAWVQHVPGATTLHREATREVRR